MTNMLKLLPDFLEEIDGEVRVKGHRIGLYDLLWEYNQGQTVEELTLRFPTVKRSTIHKIIAFYLDRQPEVDGFLNNYTVGLGKKRAAGTTGPSVAELQRRLEDIRRTQHNAAQISY